MTFIHYSIDGYTYMGNEGGIFTFKVVADANVPVGIYDVALTEVVLSIDGQAYKQPNSFSRIFVDNVDGIEEVQGLQFIIHSGDVWYNLNGHKLSAPQKGINIIRMSDGTTRKVLVK